MGPDDKVLIQLILDFWFEESGPEQWFKKNPAFDEEIRTRFGKDVERALVGDYEHWSGTPVGGMALVLLLDQFTRNIFRNAAKSFAGDQQALRLSRTMVEQGLDTKLPEIWRKFLYLPFEHSESIDDQNMSVKLYEALGNADALDYAIRHRVIVERFGRFPHRNQMLGRVSTEEELLFLEQPGSSF